MDYPYQIDGFPNPFITQKRSSLPYNDIELEKFNITPNKRNKIICFKKNVKKKKFYTIFDNRDNLISNKKIKLCN